MKTTTNYALKKPEGTDVVNVQDFNGNSDIIDGKLKELETNEIYYAVATGTANNYAISVSAITALYDGLAVCAKINIASTGASTININGLGAKGIYDSLGNPITSGGLKANTPYTLRYNGVNFILQGKGGGGNVTADKLLIGTTATGDSGAIVGTMPDNGAINITPGTTAQTIPQGYTSGGTVAGDSDLIAGNIKAGVNIFGVTGSNGVVDTADGTATADKILNTYTGYVNGAKVTGTMANNGAVTITPGATAKTIPPGYHNGSGTVATDVNLVTGNILAGKTIFGVTGKASVVDTSSANATASQILSGYTGYVNGSKLTGSMPYITGDANAHYNANNVTAGVYSGDGVNYAYLGVPSGNYLNNVSWIKSPQPHLIAQNIVNGANILGVTGNATVSSMGGTNYAKGTWYRPGAGGVTSIPLSFTPTYAYIMGGSDTYQYVAGTFRSNMWGGYGKDLYWKMNYNFKSGIVSTVKQGDTSGVQYAISDSNTWLMSGTANLGIRINGNSVELYSNVTNGYAFNWFAVNAG